MQKEIFRRLLDETYERNTWDRSEDKEAAEGEVRLKYDEAKDQLRHALRHQKTIKISKLKVILQSMNISLKQDQNTQEVAYLKGEITKLKKRLRREKYARKLQETASRRHHTNQSQPK